MTEEGFRPSLDKAIGFLRAQMKDGWWPYFPAGQAALEPTAWCALALKNDPPAANAVATHIFKTQNSDGGWSTAADTGPSDWSTSLALMALGALQTAFSEGAGKDSFAANYTRAFAGGARFLKESRTEFNSLGDWLTMLQLGSPVFLPGIPCGFPWMPGSFYWVEPTSYALLALKPARDTSNFGLHDEIERANDFLLGHSCQGGGWNHGNFISLGVQMPAYPSTTAVALIALQDLGDRKSVGEGLSFLEKLSPSLDSSMSLALSVIALNLHGRDTASLAERLVGLQAKQGSFAGNVLCTAMSACALSAQTGDNPLKFASLSKAASGAGAP